MRVFIIYTSKSISSLPSPLTMLIVNRIVHSVSCWGWYRYAVIVATSRMGTHYTTDLSLKPRPKTLSGFNTSAWRSREKRALWSLAMVTCWQNSPSVPIYTSPQCLAALESNTAIWWTLYSTRHAVFALWLLADYEVDDIDNSVYTRDTRVVLSGSRWPICYIVVKIGRR